MEDYNKNDRYRDDNRSSSNERKYDMNWDRNYNPGDDFRENGDKNVYSSDREKAYWNARDQMTGRSNRNYNNYRNQNNDRFSNYGGDANRGRNNEFRNQSYNPGYFGDNWGRQNPDMNDNYMGRSDQNYTNYNNRYNDNNPRFSDRNNNWQDNDRGWWDRTKDEVASWFGDDDAERRRHRDEMRSGEHRGKGPKNYTRSEDRIREDVSDKLSDDSFLDASNIEVSVKDGDVTLNGEVDSRYSKHRAEDLAEDVTGVKNVQNNLRVNINTDNRIYKDSVNDGNRPITTDTSYETTKNKKDFING